MLKDKDNEEIKILSNKVKDFTKKAELLREDISAKKQIYRDTVNDIAKIKEKIRDIEILNISGAISITYKQIKDVVEEVSLYDDISIKSKDGKLPSVRYIYMRLCRDFSFYIKQYSLSGVGKEINRNHASVLHGFKRFDEYGLIDDLVYKESYFIISEYMKLEHPTNRTSKAVSDYWRVKHILLQEKYRSVIRSLQKKRDSYNNINELAKKIAELEGDELKEAEIKMDAFFKIIEHRRKTQKS